MTAAKSTARPTPNGEPASGPVPRAASCDSAAQRGAVVDLIRFTVPGRAVGKGRPRVTRHGTTYTPERTRQWERLVGLLAARELVGMRGWRMDVDYCVSVHSYVSHTKKGLRRRAKGGAPDIDNVLKAVCDGLEGVAYECDEQVLRVVGETVHGAAEERCEVTVEVITC